MSRYPELTPNQDPSREELELSSRFTNSSTSTSDFRPSSASSGRFTPDIFSSVYRGFKKPKVKSRFPPTSTHSNYNLPPETTTLFPQPPTSISTSTTTSNTTASTTTTFSPTATRFPLPSSSTESRTAESRTATSTPRPQHVRNLSLQNSLKKPLPRPPSQPQPQLQSQPRSHQQQHQHQHNYQHQYQQQQQFQQQAPRRPIDAPRGHQRSFSSFSSFPSQTEIRPRYESNFVEGSRMEGRSNTMESFSAATLAGGTSQLQGDQYRQDMSNSVNSLTSSIASRQNGEENPGGGGNQTQNMRTNGHSATGSTAAATGTAPGAAAAGQGRSANATISSSSSSHLSGLMCNVHRTTGRVPHPLVGATTTILGDKLYVFGGRILSRSRPAPLTSDLYELDLTRRHWTKLETSGDVPPPRYFHSMCPLGDTKLVCYGGMSPVNNSVTDQTQSEVTVKSDIYIYDVPTKVWTYVPAQDPPQGRYAHGACILPSSASFSSHKAPLSALQHNPSSSNPNEGRIGVNIDGTGGAEMIIVGGQDSANHYIEQISVFNLRSLKWTSTQSLGKSCGSYRSVATPLSPAVAAKIGRPHQNGPYSRLDNTNHDPRELRESGSSMLIYSNYNFLDVKLELQIRSPDGALAEWPMTGSYSPPGLRFPNGGVIDHYFIVSGTYLTSSKQEYALWALDLHTLTWNRIDAGGGVFSQGSWNRGVLWNRRNTFVVLGNRKRSLVDDYNHRRINFSNVCMVELEAFGFYDNPRKTSPLSGFISAACPYSGPGLSLTRKAGYTAGGRQHSRAAEELGEKAMGMRELCDTDILCIGGERVSVNSRIVARRWGPYFVQLLREGTATQEGSDSVTLRSGLSSNPLRASAITITPSSRGGESISSLGSTIAASNSSAGMTGGELSIPGTALAQGDDINPATINTAPTPRSLPPNSRPRCLYLPHTYLTVQALLHFLYTSSLPPPSSPLCTPQILCSLLQIARPYRVDGLLEAVVERLHVLLDSRNAAAVFNATAMAAGGGRGIDGILNPNFFVGNLDPINQPITIQGFASPSLANTTSGLPGSNNAMNNNAINSSSNNPGPNGSTTNLTNQTRSLTINTNIPTDPTNRRGSDELSATTSVSGSEWSVDDTSSTNPDSTVAPDGSQSQSQSHSQQQQQQQRPVWNGELSSVIGLQKRGLRGLMEGRRMRERTGTTSGGGGGGAVMSAATQPAGFGMGGGRDGRVGLGIAGQ